MGRKDHADMHEPARERLLRSDQVFGARPVPSCSKDNTCKDGRVGSIKSADHIRHPHTHPHTHLRSHAEKLGNLIPFCLLLHRSTEKTPMFIFLRRSTLIACHAFPPRTAAGAAAGAAAAAEVKPTKPFFTLLLLPGRPYTHWFGGS